MATPRIKIPDKYSPILDRLIAETGKGLSYSICHLLDNYNKAYEANKNGKKETTQSI